jgi:phospholipase C
MFRSLRGRSAILGVATALVTVTLTTATTSAGGAVAKYAAEGNAHCTAIGRVAISPKLGAATRSTKMTITAKLTCSTGDTGLPNDASKVVSGRMTVKVAPVMASCASTNFGAANATTSWKTAGTPVANSALTFQTTTATDGTNVVLDLVGTGADESGSYQGAQVKMHIVGDAKTGGLCGSSRIGFAFHGEGGTSTFDVTTANPNNLPINHIIMLMQENRSADTYLGRLSSQGQPSYEGEPNTGNPDPTNPSGPPILPFHKTSLCEVADLDHSWNGTHHEIDGGLMDGFTTVNAIPADPTGSRAMGYYDSTDLPYYYALYNAFATNDRYFNSVPTQTFPNRSYFLAGTSFGHIRNDFASLPNRSVFNLLDEHSVSWRIYTSDGGGAYGAFFFSYVSARATQHVFPISQYFTDLANNDLPDVAYIDPSFNEGPTGNDEHPPENVQIGQKFVATAMNALMASSSWATSAFFLTYDEHGGFYDHVAPPAAVAPDATPPMLAPGDVPGGFNQYGPRVPQVVASPYSKPHYVSHVVDDHTSILKFIEYRYGLPSLTARDAAADPMLDEFDFNNAALATPPSLPAATVSPC